MRGGERGGGGKVAAFVTSVRVADGSRRIINMGPSEISAN